MVDLGGGINVVHLKIDTRPTLIAGAILVEPLQSPFAHPLTKIRTLLFFVFVGHGGRARVRTWTELADLRFTGGCPPE